MQATVFTKTFLEILNKMSPKDLSSLHMSIGKMKYNDICELFIPMPSIMYLHSSI